MALIVLTSASGSPGVTTAAVGLTLAWLRPVVLVEADPTGGSPVLAGYFRGTIAPVRGLIDLAMSHRDDHLGADLPSTLMPVPGREAWLLPGIRGHRQARSLAPVWEPLARSFKALEDTGQDVIADVGRLGLAGSPEPLIHGADLTLLALRTDLVSLSGARSWAQTLREDFEAAGASGNLGVLLVGEGRPYAAGDVAKVIGLPVVARIAWDPGPAAVFSHGTDPPRRFDGSPLVRSLRATRAAIEAAVARNRAEATPAQHGTWGVGRQ